MAGGVSGKSNALLVTALAKCTVAMQAIHQLAQQGNPTGDSKDAATDTAIEAARVALVAIQ